MGEAAIVVDDLAKSYGAVVALEGIGFEVAPGTVTGLLGPNGSGKTTTVAILATALRPDSGVARVCGHDVVRDPAGVRQMIGFAGQFAAVDANLTGRENLVLIGRLSRLGRQKARRHAVELAERFGLSDAADRLVRTYSGGMRRRLDIAAALVHRPPVIFLDEPTTGLDPESRLWLWETVRELVAGGTTALLTTQYLEEADALADQVVIIDHGRIVEIGTPAALKARVGTAVVELTFTTGADADAAESHLARSPFAAERAGSTLRVRSEHGSAAVIEILRALDGASSAPTGVAIREATLDDVFLALTGTPTARSAAAVPGGHARGAP